MSTITAAPAAPAAPATPAPAAKVAEPTAAAPKAAPAAAAATTAEPAAAPAPAGEGVTFSDAAMKALNGEPDAPQTLEIEPLPAPEHDFPPSLQQFVVDGKLDVNRITPEDMNFLNPDERQDFINYLSYHTVGTYDREDQFYVAQNAAAAFISNMQTQDPSGETLAHIYASNHGIVNESEYLLPDDWRSNVANFAGNMVRDMAWLGTTGRDGQHRDILSLDSIEGLGAFSEGLAKDGGDFTNLMVSALEGLTGWAGSVENIGAVTGALQGGLISAWDDGYDGAQFNYEVAKNLVGALPLGGVAVAGLNTFFDYQKSGMGDADEKARRMISETRYEWSVGVDESTRDAFLAYYETAVGATFHY